MTFTTPILLLHSVIYRLFCLVSGSWASTFHASAIMGTQPGPHHCARSKQSRNRKNSFRMSQEWIWWLVSGCLKLWQWTLRSFVTVYPQGTPRRSSFSLCLLILLLSRRNCKTSLQLDISNFPLSRIHSSDVREESLCSISHNWNNCQTWPRDTQKYLEINSIRRRPWVRLFILTRSQTS